MEPLADDAVWNTETIRCVRAQGRRVTTLSLAAGAALAALAWLVMHVTR